MTKNESSNPYLVKYRNNIYDISTFTHKHPGGVNSLMGLNNLDMTTRFEKAPPHSDAAMYLMNEYKIIKSKEQSNGHMNGHIESATKHTNDSEMNNNNVTFQTDDSMEHLVDWSKAMIPQISKIKSNYAEWVNKPVDRPLRLFKWNWLENLTKTPWWVVPIFWLPIICYIVLTGSREATSKQLSNYAMYLSFSYGIILWTLLEYSLHRWVFHLNPVNASAATCTFHFLLHGLHHKVPFDPYRLVFPPFPAFILTAIIYQPIPYIFDCPKLILSGGLLGYVCYDMIHYYIHYGSPRINYFYNLKRYHYQHHFVHHDKGFGISSPIWDIAFGTKIFLRKLRYLLKW